MIQQPSKDLAIIRKDGISVDQFQGWIDSMTDLINSLDMLEGNGSPEGVVYAARKKRYFNLTGAAGTLVYYKNTDITLNTGWIAIG